MARLELGTHAKLAWLLLRGGLRQFAGRVNGHPLWRWPLFSFRADRLLIAPHDLRTADATRASEIYAGRFAFAGKVVICDGRSIFDMEPPSEEWAAVLLGFAWLRHLRAADSGITRANAPRAGRRVDRAARLMASRWLAARCAVAAHHLLAQPGAAGAARRRRALSTGASCAAWRGRCAICATPRATHAAASRACMAIIALAYAALCIAGQSRRINGATDRLRQELQQQILPDGGHVGRDPGALIELLLELLPLRPDLAARNIAPPPALLNAIDRMMPMLRFFRHSDGTFAHFNGMGPTPVDLLLTLLAYDEARGAPLSNAPHSGYQRLEAGGTVLIMDAGRAPPIEMSHEAHAGCLSFEFSTPTARSSSIVNCGMPPTAREDWRQLARATPAHSTVTFNDTSSAALSNSPALRRVLGGAPMIGGPSQVSVAREDRPDSIVLRAAHDGYADRFGIVHERTLVLAADGTQLEGEDAAHAAVGRRARHGPQAIEYAVRFHLHPSVKANRLGDGHGAMLMMPHKEVWTFAVRDGQVELEDSVYLAGADGPRRTVQTRHLRSCARDAARRAGACSSPRSPSRRSQRRGSRAPKSRNCRFDPSFRGAGFRPRARNPYSLTSDYGFRTCRCRGNPE